MEGGKEGGIEDWQGTEGGWRDGEGIESEGGKGSEGERLAIDRYSLIRLLSFLFFFQRFFLSSFF